MNSNMILKILPTKNYKADNTYSLNVPNFTLIVNKRELISVADPREGPGGGGGGGRHPLIFILN